VSVIAAAGRVVAPESAWGAWSADPLTVATLLGVLALYLRGVERVWRRAGRGAVVGGWQVGCFLTGLILVAVALLSPLEGLAGTLLTVHMAQHLLLTLLAAPLLVLGAPSLPVVRGAPERLHPALHRLRLPRRLRALLAAPGAAVAAAVVHVAVLWLWHVPALYTAALRSTPLHVAEHALMLGSAMWLWSTLVAGSGPVRRPNPVGALAMFLTATLSVGVGVLLTFSPAAVYPVYEPGAAAWGLTALADQQQAGAMMWSISGAVYMAAGAVVFGAWLARAARRGASSRRDVPPGPEAGSARVIADTTPLH
jgi:putative membrane protein